MTLWYSGKRNGDQYHRSLKFGEVLQIRKRSAILGAAWVAFYPNGKPVRVDTNADGSPYVARPWHDEKDMPIRRYFPSAAAARSFLEKAYAEPPACS